MFIVIILFNGTLIKYNVGLWVVIIHNRTLFCDAKINIIFIQELFTQIKTNLLQNIKKKCCFVSVFRDYSLTSLIIKNRHYGKKDNKLKKHRKKNCG